MAFSAIKNVSSNVASAVTGAVQQGIGDVGLGTILDFLDPSRKSDAKGEGNYPEKYPVLNVIDPDLWDKSLPYVFSVVVLDGNGGFSNAKGFTDFPMPLNPSEINQDENFSILVRPTQGGTAVYHSGIRYGDLFINGTTGLYPFKGKSGPTSNEKVIFHKDTKNLKNKSGYEVFLRLRNYFKAYAQYNADEKTYKKVSMVFKNYKDSEFLVVEPVKFSMKRNRENKTFRDYSISLKIIGRVKQEPFEAKDNLFGYIDNILESVKSAIDTIDAARATCIRYREVLQNIHSNYRTTVLGGMRTLSLFAKSIAGVAPAWNDVLAQPIKETNTDLASESAGVTKMYEQFLTDMESIGDFLGESSKKAWENAEKTFGFITGTKTKTPTAEDFIDHVENEPLSTSITASSINAAQLSNYSEKVTRRDIVSIKTNLQSVKKKLEESDTFKDDVPDNKKLQLLKALEDTIKQTNYLLLQKNFFKESFSERIADLQSLWVDDLGIFSEPAMSEITILQDDTLQKISLRELGTISRWPELIILNELDEPYIVDSKSKVPSGKNVKVYGEKLLIPAQSEFGFSATLNGKESKISLSQNEFQKNQGVDLFLQDDADLELDEGGDIKVIYGVNNTLQGLLLKLNTMKGENLDFPTLGLDLPIGKKHVYPSEMRLLLNNTILSDPRVESISNLEIRRDLSPATLSIVFQAKLKDIDIPIQIQFNKVA